MATGQLGPTGFERRPLSEIILNIKNKMQEAFPEEIVFDESSPDMQQIGVVSEQYSDLWDFLLELWNQLDPDNAQGVMLDRINNGIRGVPRILYEPTKVVCQLTGTPGELLVAGSLARSSVVLSSPNFSLMEDVIFDVAGNATGVFIATDNGIYVIGAGEMDTIVTISADWLTITNAQDGVTGVPDESDSDYRIRGQKSTSIRGQGYIDAVESNILNLAGVTQVKVYENKEATTDANGLVAKAICCFVRGGVDQDIFDVLFKKANFGPKQVGTQTGYSNDFRGVPHPQAFERPTEISMVVEVNVTEKTGWTLSKVQAIKDAIIAYYNGTQNICGLTSGYDIADTVRASDYYPGLSVMSGFALDSIQVKRTGGVYAQSEQMDWDEYPVIVDADITVNHAP
jgi:uncharacterized phage protein gp47/JayE